MPRHPERSVASRRPSAVRTNTLAAGVLAGILVLAGCSGLGGPDASASPSVPPSGSASAVPTPTPTATLDPGQVLVPDGTAEDNLPLFTAITAAVWASPDAVSGRAYIDALVAAGFDKAAMQVTQDRTTVGNPAESLQFSVRWGEECLIGQVGPETGTPVTVVVPALAEGTCLIGQTRPIDW